MNNSRLRFIYYSARQLCASVDESIRDDVFNAVLDKGIRNERKNQNLLFVIMRNAKIDVLRRNAVHGMYLRSSQYDEDTQSSGEERKDRDSTPHLLAVIGTAVVHATPCHQSFLRYVMRLVTQRREFSSKAAGKALNVSTQRINAMRRKLLDAIHTIYNGREQHELQRVSTVRELQMLLRRVKAR